MDDDATDGKSLIFHGKSDESIIEKMDVIVACDPAFGPEKAEMTQWVPIAGMMEARHERDLAEARVRVLQGTVDELVAANHAIARERDRAMEMCWTRDETIGGLCVEIRDMKTALAAAGDQIRVQSAIIADLRRQFGLRRATIEGLRSELASKQATPESIAPNPFREFGGDRRRVGG